MATLGRNETGENVPYMSALETNGGDHYLQNFGSHSQKYKIFYPKILHSLWLVHTLPDNVQQLHVRQTSTYAKPETACAVLGS
jgi:hypothetical protein